MAARGASGARGGSGRKPAPHRKTQPGRTGGTSKPRTGGGQGDGKGTRRAGITAATSASAPSSLPAGPFRLGAIEGATPGKWIDVWKERMPGIPLELVPLEVSTQRTAVVEASVDAALMRLPIDRSGLNVIALYEETPVVVCAADSHLTAADELTLADLAGEVVISPAHPPLELTVDGAVTPRFAPPATVGEAIATAATGVGVVVVPMSLARLHHRKDAAYRPLVDGPVSPVALVWPAAPGGETPALVDAFIGIVRGRTARSSR